MLGLARFPRGSLLAFGHDRLLSGASRDRERPRFAALPKALEDIHANTLRAAKACGAEAVVTTFHQCYREIVGLDAARAIDVYNYIHLIARSMGLPYEDDYKAWKRAGDGATQMIGAERIAKVGVEFYERAVLPELKKRPTLR